MPETTFQGTPEWYGGDKGYIKSLLERAESESKSKYVPFKGDRIAPFSPLQEQSFQIAQNEASNPAYPNIFQQSYGLIRDASGRDVSSQLEPYLEAGTANPVENAQQYMNPYQEQVVNNIGRLASRNLNENILPNVKDRFIRAGQYGSSGHQTFANRAVRDTQEAVANAQANALHGGYNTALQTAVGQQERNLQAGQLAGSALDKDIARKLVSGEALQQLGTNQQNQGLRTAGYINQLGGQQQQQRQNAYNTAYQEFQNQQNYPYFQTARFNEIARGIPVNSQQFANNFTPPPPQASPWTQGAGILGGLTGAFNQRQGYAQGGVVKQTTPKIRHYAQGGGAPTNPIQMGVNHALDTAEIKAMRDEAQKLSRPQVDPFWSSIARAGFNIASNRQPGVLAAIGQGANAGLDEYNSQLSRQDERGMGSARIMSLIDNTRRMQAENNRSHQLELEKFGQHQKEFGMRHSLEQQKFAMDREKHLADMGKQNLITGKDGALYELTKDSNGETKAKLIEGITPTDNTYKKSNEKAMEQVINSYETLPSLKSSINELEKVANSLDTGPYKGKLSKAVPTIEDVPLIGKSISAGKAKDIASFESLTNQLALDLANQIKGANIALGTRKIIAETKPSLTNTKEGNLEILHHMKSLANLVEEKNNFLSEVLNSGGNAIDAHKAFNKYANAKLEAEDKNIKFNKIPSDFLNDNEFKSSIENSEEKQSNAELKRRMSSVSAANITPQMARTELERRKNVTTSPQEMETSQETIHPRLKAKLFPEEKDTKEKLKRSAVRGTKNALMAGTDVLDLLALPVRGGNNKISEMVGSKFQIPTLGSNVENTFKNAYGDKSLPQNDQEKVADEVVRAVGSLPFGGAAGRAISAIKNAPKAIGAVGNFLKGSNALTPTNVAATGATGAVVQNALNENPQDILGAAGKGLGTGIGVAATPGILSLLSKKGRATTLAPALAKSIDLNPEAIESFKQSGISPTLADVSNSGRVKMLSSKLEKLPFIGGPLQEARELQKKQLIEGLGVGDQSDNLSRMRGAELTKKGAKNYQKSKENVHQQLFSKVEKDIESLPDDTIGIKSVNEFFAPIFKKFKTSSQEARFKKSPLGKMYVDLYETAKQNGGKVPYYDLKDRLDEINDMITTHGLIGKVSQGKLKSFAGAIAKDIENDLSPKFEALGGNSLENWKKSKELYREYAQGDIPNLNDLFKRDKKGATEAFIDILSNQKKGAEKTRIVLEGLDNKDKLELINNINKDFGRTTDGSFSPLKWVRQFKNLEPGAQDVLLSPLDESTRKKVFSIADTIDHMKSTLNEANTSKTAYYTALGTVATLGGKAVLSLASGNPLPAAKLAGGLFLGRIASEKLLTNPKFINWMDKAMKAKDLKHFERNLERVPSIGKFKKTLHKEAHTFLRDLDKAREENKRE